MRKIILAIVAVLILTGSAWAVDTTLTSPLVITAPATIMKQYSFTIIPSENKVRALMNFVDASGNLVQTRECEFKDAAIVDAVITANKVDKKYVKVLSNLIQTKCKTVMGLSGEDVE